MPGQGSGEINRRGFLALPALLAAASVTPFAAAARESGVFVHDVTMAAPDIICLVVRDQKIEKGELMSAPAANPGKLNQIVEAASSTGELRPALVVGRGGTHLRFFDRRPMAFLNRAAIDAAKNFQLSGDRKVVSVHRLSMPYDQGTAWDGEKLSCVSFEHHVYLKLDGPLPAGTLRIANREADIEVAEFAFSDMSTRSSSIHATQVGHRPNDSKKMGYLSVWIPNYGYEGRVDLPSEYGLSGFDVIDGAGQVVWSGKIEPRLRSEEAEDAAKLIAYPTTVKPPRKIERIDQGEVTSIVIGNHGYYSDQVKVFRGVSGLNGALEGRAYKISVTDADTFTVPVNTLAAAPHVPGAYLEGYDSLVYDVSLANRAATDVYQLDYSGFRPSQAGVYRLRVTGLGCSDPFRIDERVHYDTAHHAMKGYYNQCWGMPLSRAVGGWERPVNYRDGVNGVTIKESKLPACMEAETGLASPALARKGHAAPWITENRVAGWFGGWSDAGDWDMHIARHGTAVWLLLDLGYERLPETARMTDFGFPKSSQTFMPDAAFEGTDGLPDAVHMAIYYIEPLRRYQKPDGRVYGGMNYDGNGGGSAGGGNGFEPSWISQQEAHLLAADHCSNFHYAACAAKLGRLLTEAGFERLGRQWIESAGLAWQWAERIWSSYREAGSAGAAWLGYYEGELAAISNAGWDENQVKRHFDSVQGQANEARIFAAGSLFTATGSERYRAILEYKRGALSQTGIQALGTWEYAQGKRGDRSHKDYYNGRWHIDPDNQYTEHFGGKTSYMFNGKANFFGPSGIPSDLIYAYLTRPRIDGKKYLDLLHAGEDFVTGANQSGLCCTTGLGARWPTQPLHRDREAVGLNAEDIPGLTLYMWWHDNSGGLFVFNFGDDSPLNFIVDRPLAGHAESVNRMAEPYWRSIPAMQQHWQNTFVIFNTEFVTQQQILGRFIANLWRHGWDGNPAPGRQ
jgi:endoglucanase